ASLITLDWAGDPVPNQAVEVNVVERRWSSVQEQDPQGRTVWTYEVEEIPVTTANITTDADGRAAVTFTPPNGGIFKIQARTRDDAGNEVIAASTIWASSSEYVAWRQQNSNRIDLIADNDTYAIGDTAEILIASPFQGEATALITVERGDVLSREVVTLTSNSFVYELPILDDFAPNVYVSAFIVKGVDATNPVAAFRMGMVQFTVDNAQKEITVEIAPNVDQAGPGDTVGYTVRTTDYTGAPVVAEVGVGLSDLATLTVAEPNSGPLLTHFYGQRGLSIRTASPLTINTDQLTQTTLDTVKGGGGGFGEGGIFDIREEFVDTPYWNPAVVTNADGVAQFEVTLPDNLTTWRLDARAVTSGADGLTLVGQETFDLLSTRPVLVRPVTPRFFIVGDEVRLAAIVNNNTDEDLSVEVALQATGVTFTDAAAQTVNIGAGQRQRVEWPVTVDAVEAVDLTFFANANDGAFTDASKPPLGQGDARLLPVYRYEVPEIVGTAGVLRDSGTRTEAILLPEQFAVTQGALNVSLEPSLAAAALDGLGYLEDFPYLCTEQTVSRFLPNIMTYRALAAAGLADAELEAQLERNVDFALQRLFAQQKVDGGWGWYVQDRSNPLVTAYALIGLIEARDQGFAVSDSVIQNAQGYVEQQFIALRLGAETWRLNRQTFMLYALARSGQADVARTMTMFENRAALDIYAQAFLALTLHSIDPNDGRIDTLLSDLANAAVVSATGTHWQEDQRDFFNWNTDTRTTAIALEALVTLRPESALIPNVVRWLMSARTADVWESTQETAWAVMALTDWMVASDELNADYTYAAVVNGATIATGTAERASIRDQQSVTVAVSELLTDVANDLVINRGAGPGALYYTAHLDVSLPVEAVEPLNRGIIIERRYLTLDTLTGAVGQTPVESARVGDTLQVRLTIIAPNDLHYVQIEDPIPAGADAVDPNLAISQQVGTRPEIGGSNPLSRGWGWWWFSNTEFRDEKVVLSAEYLPAGTYEYVYTIRAGLPGVYNVIPPTGYEFYFPEVYGRGAGMTFTILP
ncbi:MAG: alpha-2-macroglobulin, partial [Chloroflexi bacterium]|nr:alpha-2-macroglobulin [Chloroflexota bacterium]